VKPGPAPACGQHLTEVADKAKPVMSVAVLIPSPIMISLARLLSVAIDKVNSSMTVSLHIFRFTQ